MTTPLKPGDVLLYRPSSWVGWAIAIKTASRVASHIEIAVRPGLAIAARQEGVNYYPTRWNKLSRVLRPNKPIDVKKGLDWFDANAKGQRYDYLALGRFFIIPGLKQSTDKQICSELATRWFRNAAIGWVPFGCEDADLIEPRDYLKCDDFDVVWSDET
jgi:hypothetical protein